MCNKLGYCSIATCQWNVSTFVLLFEYLLLGQQKVHTKKHHSQPIHLLLGQETCFHKENTNIFKLQRNRSTLFLLPIYFLLQCSQNSNTPKYLPNTFDRKCDKGVLPQVVRNERTFFQKSANFNRIV